MEIIPVKTKLFKTGENLSSFLLTNLPALENGDVAVITSKIVALSQGRVGTLADKGRLIRAEAKKIIKTPWALLTLTDDGWCLNAGVDESNAAGKLILLPEDPYRIVEVIRAKLAKHFKLKKLGIIITDTKSVPLRVGTIGRALAYAGFEPLRSYIGKKDLFGRKTRYTESNIADALAASAVLTMGEGNEQKPLAVIRRAPLDFIGISEQKRRRTLVMSPDEDIYAPIFVIKKPSRRHVGTAQGH